MTITTCDSCKSVKQTVTISKTFQGNEQFPFDPMAMTLTLCAQCVGTHQVELAVA